MSCKREVECPTAVCGHWMSQMNGVVMAQILVSDYDFLSLICLCFTILMIRREWPQSNVGTWGPSYLATLLVGSHMGPSIYDVHAEKKGVRQMWTHADGGGGQAHVDVHT